MKRVFLAFIVCLSFGVVDAQESGINPHSLNPVHDSYIMYSRTLWRRMDLEEKQNDPFFSRNRELPRIIIESVKNGLLFPYQDDSLNTRMSKETFLEQLKLPEEDGGLSEEEKAMGFGAEDDGFGDWGDFGGTSDNGGADEGGGGYTVEEFSPRDFSIVELKEDLYFDRMRSRMYYDIISLGLFLPAEKNPALYEKPLAFFRYKDLVSLFRKLSDDAIWYNSQNMAEHKNLADAFELRLFSANLVKYANPSDQRIVEIFSRTRKDGIIASKKIEYELIEFENELWEF